MKYLCAILETFIFSIGAFAQGFCKQQAFLGHTNVCDYEIEYLTVNLSTGIYTPQPSSTIPAAIPGANMPMYIAPGGDYITEFKVRPVGSSTWNIVNIPSSTSAVPSIFLNFICTGGGTMFRQIGFDQSGATTLYIALHEQ